MSEPQSKGSTGKPAAQAPSKPNGHPPLDEEDFSVHPSDDPKYDPRCLEYLDPVGEDPAYDQQPPREPPDHDWDSQPPEPPRLPPATEALRKFEEKRRGRKLHLIRASEVKIEPIHWLWSGWLPAGFCWLEGDSGTNKSMIASLMASIASTTRPFPSSKISRIPINTLYLSSGEDPDSTIAERCVLSGGNLERVFLLDVKKIMSDPQPGEAGGLPVLPNDAPLILEAAHACEAKLIVLDAAFSFISAAEDIFNDHEFRAAIEPFARACADSKLTIIALRHFTKTRQTMKNQGIGAVAGTAVARSVLTMNEDPTSPGAYRLLSCSKLSYGARPLGSLRFRIEATGPLATAWVSYQGTSTITGNAATAAARDPKAADALAFYGQLREAFRTVLKDGAEIPVSKHEGYELTVDAVARSVGYIGQDFPNSKPGRRLIGDLKVLRRKIGPMWFWRMNLRGNS